MIYRIRVKSYGFRKLMTIIIDHNKQRCHGDGAVYFIHSMTPCILPVAAVKSPQASSACPGLTRSATELCGR